MRRIKISNYINKTGDTAHDYLLKLYSDNMTEPVTLNGDTDYKIKIGNDIGYLKTISGKLNEDNNGLILLAKDLADFPDGSYYVEVWFNKDGLNYIYPSNGKARIKLDANIESIKGKLIPTITIEELRKEIANSSTTSVKGPKGDIGPKGPAGKDGEPGKDGESAYQIWLDDGNQGNEADFINSLKGPKGDTGERGPVGLQGEPGAEGQPGKNGENGAPGKDGLSAYQIWLALGNSGTEQDFINSLKGSGDNIDLSQLKFYIPAYSYNTSNGSNRQQAERNVVINPTDDGKYVLNFEGTNKNVLKDIYLLQSRLSTAPATINQLKNQQDKNVSNITTNTQAIEELKNKIDDLKEQIEDLKKSEQ